jgi:hypothetical protein
VENAATGIPILAYAGQKPEPAILSYSPSGPEISMASQSSHLALIESFSTSHLVAVDADSRSCIEELSKPLKVHLKPLFHVERKYVPSAGRIEPLYPPSSYNWLSRVADIGRSAIFFIHEIENDTRYWLSAIDAANCRFFEAHPIHRFEAGILILEDEVSEYERMKSKAFGGNLDTARKWMNKMLSGPPPTWAELAVLTEDVYIPGLSIGKDMKETMAQLVPASFEQGVRNQIMAFLAMASKGEIPAEDPVEFFNSLNPLEVLRVLLMGHYIAILTGNKPPPYVRLIQESEMYRASIPESTVSSSHEKRPWTLPIYYQIGHQPEQIGEVSIGYANRLNVEHDILTELPISKAEAKRSRKKWAERFLLKAYGIQLRTFPFPEAFGLKRLVYIGTAHQWPHLHMKFSAILASDSYKDPHIQLVEVPIGTLEPVMDARPSFVEIDWSSMTVNGNHFDFESKTWKVSVRRILNSVGGKRSLRRLKNEFGAWKGKVAEMPSRVWAKSLDITANLSYLDDFENKTYLKSIGITSRELKRSISEMVNRNICKAIYLPRRVGLISLVIQAQGPAEHLCSLSRALLKHSVTCSAYLGKDGEWLSALIRLPPSAVHEILATLPEHSAEVGISSRCYRTKSYRSYLRGFYQRLLQEDGTWNTDISGMVSQIRVPYRQSDNDST